MEDCFTACPLAATEVPRSQTLRDVLAQRMDNGFAHDPPGDFSNAYWPDSVFLLKGEKATGEKSFKAGRVDVYRTKSPCGSGERLAKGKRAGPEREELLFPVFGVPT